MRVNSYLKDLAQRAIVRNDERNGINVSIETIKSRLKSYFGNEIKEILIFGSYRRRTIISRNFDDNSDIDMMSPTRVVRSSELVRIMRPKSSRSFLPNSMSGFSSSCENPTMALSGVRISWLMFCMNMLFILSETSARLRASSSSAFFALSLFAFILEALL